MLKRRDLKRWAPQLLSGHRRWAPNQLFSGPASAFKQEIHARPLSCYLTTTVNRASGIGMTLRQTLFKAKGRLTVPRLWGIPEAERGEVGSGKVRQTSSRLPHARSIEDDGDVNPRAGEPAGT